MNSQRLAAPMGRLIDRDKPVSFSFEGREYWGYQGDSIASALAAQQQWVLSRSFKYHRPRGPLTMAGHDANSLVQLRGEPNVLADRRTIEPGLEVKGQNYVGSLKHDLDALQGYFGRFMPVGFYYRAFYKPLGVWDSWEKFLRAKAGLGVIDLEHEPSYHDKAYLFYDLMVVGAGPAGMQAALDAAQAGAQVLLVDENPLMGGSLNYHRFDIDNQAAEQLRAQLIEQIEAHDNINVLLQATCSGYFRDNYLPVVKDNRLYKVRAKECIMAVGSMEQHAVFHNNDLPGIMLSSAAMRLMSLYAVKPGERAVVLAGNDDAYLTALSLAEQGVEVAALVDMRPAAQNAALAEAMSAHGIEILYHSAVYQAEATFGHKHIKGVEVRPLIAEGQVGEKGQRISCDLLCVAVGYMPSYQLLCQAGGQLSYNDERASFHITQLPEHLRMAGSVNSMHELTSVLQDAHFAAQTALGNLGLEVATPVMPAQCDQQVNHPWPMVAHPRGKDFVDFDEDLQSKDIINATKLGYRDVQLVKRFSTVGMGPSQGRHSAAPTARLVAKATDRSVQETGVTTARPPLAAETLAHIGGRIFTPYKYSPMHNRHLEAGAKMMPAGVWQRPGHYGAPEQRQHRIQAEVNQVRNGVGVIDVSTLGGIELRGPDAAEMMERIYTFGFKKQPIGKTRYAVHTNEHGVVIDDGVACRIADDYFYVTATTSGVDRVYRAMLKWNAMWRLNVVISNVTEAYAAVNVAGPKAREVLAKLTDIDISAEGFPYLAYREGQLLGVEARFMRVGFVGELGYEIHLPANYGQALWDAVIEAGSEFGIQPFGVEAQRLLRLEKGHIIVGQDTDGMSHPGEVHLDWAVNRKKPFFVGRRSVDIVQAQTQKRRLVAFTLAAKSAKPEEGHLVLAGPDISGNVTSCEYSPTLDCIIGLAYASVEQAAIGSDLPIRVDGGKLVTAKVVSLPFFDADNSRQEM
ncbi:2Fe-2S iron-sulfur cluster-binding protein [Reinekea thalattae]|uniref:FAD-dependent oxidoreductase n=1 Tax=Reinekea thalattae TaxID=2593301 RepID=A0A5C8Z8D3_9GAMM|nr:2Fe-2S iron-sulfur cluster-binding protein [Reinekea thalattae]TXR53170.1 FAD-dependent oxidoreductase [Reinekea thalattae]